MAQQQTMESLAARLYPLLLDKSADSIVPDGFFVGGKVSRENWKKFLDAVFYAPVVRGELRDYLQAAPELDSELLVRHKTQLEFTFTKIPYFNGENAPFNPAKDKSELLLDARTTHADLVDIFNVLERNPHIFITIAHAQNFYGHYVSALERSVVALADDASKERIGTIFKKLNNVTMGNQDFFVHAMLFQYVLVHHHFAAREGRELGTFTLADFMAIDRYTHDAKLFTQRGGVCPFGYAHKQSMRDRDEGGIVVSGLNLWRLHQHIAPYVNANREELIETVQICAARFRDEMASRAQRAVCPYHSANIT